MIYDLPYFGEITIPSLKGYHMIKTEIDGRRVNMDLYLDKKFEYDKKAFDDIKNALNNVQYLDNMNKRHMIYSYHSKGFVEEYIDYHIKEYGYRLLEKLNIDPDSPNKELELLSRLEFIRIGVYYYKRSSFLMFDYHVDGSELRKDVVANRIDYKGNLLFLAWERWS